ncbi:MAG: hypothetical protein IJZ09_01450 [Tidjanibacter sp.]|nr:hypothetical protein [Tidjanibacter sp.]
MKKIFRYAAMICAAALAVACAEEPQDEPIVEHPTTKDMTFTTEAATPDSRVLFADGEGLAWENADLTKMAVCYDEAGAWKHTCSTSGAINEGTATFTATVDAESVFAYCYYPYAENSATDAIFAYDFAAALTQSEAGRTTALRLASGVIDIEGEVTNVTAQFHNVGSLLRYFIYAAESDEKVESVALEATAPIAGTYTYNLATAEGEIGGTTSNEVTVTLGTALSLEGITAADKAKSVFMPIVPATSEGVTYVVTTDKNVYEFVSTAAHTWAEGAVTEIKLNLAKATNVTPIGGGEGPDTSNATEIIYCFTNMAVQTAYNFPATEGVAATDYYIVDEGEFGNHIFDYTKPYYTTMRMEYLDATSNEVVDWVTLSTRANDNKLDFAYQANSGAERTAIINIYWDDTEEYKVVGTYKKADKSYEEITTADPIMTITVTQAAGAVTPDPEPDPEPSDKQQLYYLFRDKNGAFGAKEVTVENAGRTIIDNAWFLVGVGGTSNDKLILSNYQNEPPYRDLRFECPEWMEYAHSGQNVTLRVLKNTSAEERVGTFKIYSNVDTAVYEVVYADGSTITIEDPVFEVTVTQAAGTGLSYEQLIYQFTNKGVAVNHNFAKDGGLYTASYNVKVDGTEDTNYTAAYYQGWRYEAVDANGNTVDWVRAYPFSNQVNVEAQANIGEERTATINLYWDDTDAYHVVGTHKAEGGALTEITTTEPIMTFNVTQASAQNTSELVYMFTNAWANNPTGGNGGALWPHAYYFDNNASTKGSNGYQVKVDGVVSSNNGADFYQKWTYKAVDVVTGEEVTWVSAAPFSNTINFTVEANSTGAGREAYVHIYWNDNDSYKVVGTHKDWNATYEAIDTTQPIYTATIKQGISYSDIVYEFTTKNVKNHNYNVAASGVNSQNISWYAAFCNRNDTANGEYFNLSCRAYDATTGEEITWARAGAASNGKNEIVFFCDANDTGAERKAIVNLYWYNTDTYKVVGTYKTASSPNTFTPITDSENEPVLTLTLTQAAQ